MESLENSWEGPTNGLEDDNHQKFKIVGNPPMVAPSTEYGIIVGNALTRPPLESSHLFQDSSTGHDAPLVPQDSLSLPGDDSVAGGHRSSVPLFVASLPASVRNQLASWGYPASAGASGSRGPHDKQEQEEYAKDTNRLGERLSLQEGKLIESWPDMNFQTQMTSGETKPSQGVQMTTKTKTKEELGPKLMFVNVWNTVAGIPVLAGQKVLLKWPKRER